MGAYKDKNGTWFASARYKNWAGETKRKMKRGFPTKRDALAWEREFITQHDGNLEMTFESFYELYKNNEVVETSCELIAYYEIGFNNYCYTVFNDEQKKQLQENFDKYYPQTIKMFNTYLEKYV